jgi:hypothetical protein
LPDVQKGREDAEDDAGDAGDDHEEDEAADELVISGELGDALDEGGERRDAEFLCGNEEHDCAGLSSLVGEEQEGQD